MTDEAPRGRRLIVSGADAPYFGLLRALLLSLRRLRLLEAADFGVLDAGLKPEQRAWLADQGAILVTADWGFDFPLAERLERERPSLKILTSRPRLPRLFPGYDTILWLDADLWVEHDSGWTLSVTHSGDLFLEDLTGDEEEYWTLGPLPEAEILPLLTALTKGDIRTVRAQKWERGE